MRYIRGTTCYGIYYTLGDPRIISLIDSDWASDIDDHKSTFGFVFCLGFDHITWSFKKWHDHTLSSTKAEYKETVLASQELFVALTVDEKVWIFS